MLVPAGVVTLTSTTAPPGGLVAESSVSEMTTNSLTAALPNFTAVAPVKPDPVTVTDVPPPPAPPGGSTWVMFGA